MEITTDKGQSLKVRGFAILIVNRQGKIIRALPESQLPQRAILIGDGKQICGKAIPIYDEIGAEANRKRVKAGYGNTFYHQQELIAENWAREMALIGEPLPVPDDLVLGVPRKGGKPSVTKPKLRLTDKPKLSREEQAAQAEETRAKYEGVLW